MMQSDMCRAAVFHRAGRPLTLETFPRPKAVPPGGALCRVLLSTICGSDIHTIKGDRLEPSPLILGHEIIGEVAALGEGLTADGNGLSLRVGDRVSWTIMAACGHCWFCLHDLPQKCDHLRKYGHSSCREAPFLTGGFAEMIQLFPGTTIYRVPDALSDAVATPANCALATAVNAAESVGCLAGRSILIQGAGMLGLNLVVLAREHGAAQVMVTDVRGGRLELARRFGADLCIDVSETATAQDAVTQLLRDRTEGRGVDAAFEVCGDPAVVSQAVAGLRIGGDYLLAGMVSPGSDIRIDGNAITRRYLTVRGIHNYKPRHLGVALEILSRCSDKYPFADLVQRVYPLAQINEALSEAAEGTDVRVGVRP